MGKSTADDPLGQRDPAEDFTKGLERLIDERIAFVVRGRTMAEFDRFSDAQLMHELIARGWAVFRPSVNPAKGLK